MSSPRILELYFRRIKVQNTFDNFVYSVVGYVFLLVHRIVVTERRKQVTIHTYRKSAFKARK